METNVLQRESLKQKQKRINKRKRKIVRRVILLQLAFLAIASHYASAEPVGIIKYYSMELTASLVLMMLLMKIKESKKNNTIKEKEEKIKEVVGIEKHLSIIERKKSRNYNWVIKNTANEKIKEVEKEEVKENVNAIEQKKELKKEEKVEDEKVIYKSPFDVSIDTDADKKIKYKSPFEPFHEGNVVLELESAMDDFCYCLTTNDKYNAKVYKKVKNDELAEEIETVECEEIVPIESFTVIEDNKPEICDVKTVEEQPKKVVEPNITAKAHIVAKEMLKYKGRLGTQVSQNNKEKQKGICYKKRIDVLNSKAKELDRISYKGEYNFPTLDLLDDNKFENEIDYKKDEEKGDRLIETLASFNVGASIVNISHGSSVTRYEILPDAGVKVSKIINLQDDIALALAATGVRIAPVAGKSVIGIEVPNEKVIPVYLKEVLSSKEFINHKSNLAFGLGKEVTGNIEIGDVEKMPHVLIAGATGSGKSVCLNSLIISILYKSSPKDVRMLMIDPKMVEMSIYNGIPHLLIPVVTEPEKAIGALNWAVLEMESRYLAFANERVRDLKGYNKIMEERGEEKLPQILIIIDELADLMMVAPHEIESSITRLAQKSRACGIHLVIATQRPSVDVITGLIKANVPSRISFAVASQIDSRTILDMAGAEKLLGRGDMLYNPIGVLKPIRVQGAFLKDKEVYNVVSYIKNSSDAEYQDSVFEIINNTHKEEENDTECVDNSEDELLRKAIDMVLEYEQASASFIQRKFKVGYARAARILDQMEEWGIVSKAEGSKARQILTTKEEWNEVNM